MQFEDKKVTLGNYQEVFKGMSKDILEVIRSALFDDTPIQDYIKVCQYDPIRLWEIKLAMDENIDDDIVDMVKSGDILYKVRQLNNRGFNLQPLKKYFEENLPERYLKYILKWYSAGVVLDKYNFSILPENLLQVFDKGINLRLPMYVFNTGKGYSSNYVSQCMVLLSNGRSVSRYLSGNWYEESLKMLADYSKSKRFEVLEEYIKEDITPGMLEVLINATKAGMNISDVATVTTDGDYAFLPIQVSIITEAFKKGLNTEKLLDPNHSPDEMRAMVIEDEYNSSKTIKGLL